MKKALVFDLDGTLLDTLGDLRGSVNYALKKYGFPERTTEEVRNFVGNGLKMLIIRALPRNAGETLVNAVLAEMKAYYAAHCTVLTTLYDGIIEALSALKAEGYPMAIVSNKADALVQQLRAYYFEGLIAVAAGESEQNARKPAPDMVFSAMRALGVSQAIYIGDSEVDIQTAKNAGLPCLTVGWGFRTDAELTAAGAKAICRSPADLLTMLDAL